jgi:hypothetical protein
MVEFDEEALKRLIRTMNSVLNLYDIEGIPIEIVHIMYKPINDIMKLLKIPVKTKSDGETIDKFIMPENFSRWLETNGEFQT